MLGSNDTATRLSFSSSVQATFWWRQHSSKLNYYIWLYSEISNIIRLTAVASGRNREYLYLEELCLLGHNPRSPVKVNRRLGETHRLHLQGRRVKQARNNISIQPASAGFFFLFLLLDREDEGDMIRRNIGWLSPHFTQETECFMVAAIRNSNPTWLCFRRLNKITNPDITEEDDNAVVTKPMYN